MTADFFLFNRSPSGIAGREVFLAEPDGLKDHVGHIRRRGQSLHRGYEFRVFCGPPREKMSEVYRVGSRHRTIGEIQGYMHSCKRDMAERIRELQKIRVMEPEWSDQDYRRRKLGLLFSRFGNSDFPLTRGDPN